MATGQSDYVRGQMEVSDHKHTFGGFMNWTVYGGSLVALLVIYPTLIFGVHLGWPTALFTTVIIGMLMGVGLKLKGVWYAGVIGSAVFLAIASALIKLLAGYA